MKFAPHVLAVPEGATVNFPNQDRVNHHVYSFSKVQPFQFPLYGQGKTRSMKFDHAGTVAVACNIHDSMSAYIRIVDTPYFAMTDASGASQFLLARGVQKLRAKAAPLSRLSRRSRAFPRRRPRTA